ncbi:hypothetical protein FRACYDRAFT_233452 [Fragilariopsis cylindrus CCMP1102]|uniref:Uncharacterized protein n=1 Tax=Fragilariopsis cylindrus CCMP1102 TaxID=635003 RepID=A0A1E7FYQ3_9STRA|nr:hypothetical protein FRACYDRAFT_233452 [Fragilariopsis cylindrus CCMP1102]|eukprot:OEU23279.1 hypothetical protein FRACYDRAFT_233452 [Fragilariopsis cylindrus CCMP1102]
MMDEIDDRQAEAVGQIAATATAAAASAECRRQHVELISVLTKHDEFHLRTRNKIDELVCKFLRTIIRDIDDQQQEGRRQHVVLISVLKQHDEYHWRTGNKIDELVEEFVTKTKDDIHDMLCDNKDEAPNDDDRYDRYYRGLDSNRDTAAEVETALRFFPEVLSRRGGPYNKYPIQYLAIKVKAVPFIPLVVQLALEFGLFEEIERGGLMFDVRGHNILQFLVNDILNDQHVDDMYLNVMIQLRQMGYFKKEDIQKYGLVVVLCRCSVISEKRFRFLVEWDPTSLIKRDGRAGHPDGGAGHLPLHVATISTSTIQDFRMAFEYGIRYYPRKKGICSLFQNSYYYYSDYRTPVCRSGFGPTPLQLACTFKRYTEDVMKVVEDILIPAIDENIHLDCVYFLLRREPDVMQLTSSSLTLSSLTLESNDNNLSAPLPVGGTAPTPGMGGFSGGPSQTPGMGGFGGGGTTLTPTPGGFGGGGFGQLAPSQQQAQAGGFSNTTFNAQAGGQFSLGTGPAIGSRRILKARRPR